MVTCVLTRQKKPCDGQYCSYSKIKLLHFVKINKNTYQTMNQKSQ